MSTIAESYVVKLNYDGQMRRFPVAVGTSFHNLRDQVSALLALPKNADVVLKYSDEEGDLITISSDLELTSALVPGKLLRLTVLDRRAGEGGVILYPHLDAPMLDAAPSAPMQSVGADAFRGFPSDGSAPPQHPPGFIVPGYGVGPHSHPHPPPPPHPHPHAHPHGPHRGGPHHHHHRGGFGHHGRGGFHGYGPYGVPSFGGASREDWRAMRKEDKIARKEMKREFKEAQKAMKKDKEGGGRGGRKGKGEREGYPLRCADGMTWAFASESASERFVARFAKDVSVPDGTQIQPRTPFVKTWRLRNEGPAWPAGCMLRFLGKHSSDNMGACENTPLPLAETVAPNTEVEVSVNLVAPEKPGRYTGYWKMCTPEGRKFGQRVWVSIVVPSSSPSTPTTSSSSSSSDSDKEADRYEALVDRVLSTGMNVKRHRVFRMLQKCDGDVNAVCEKLAKKEEKKTRKAMKKQMKI